MPHSVWGKTGDPASQHHREQKYLVFVHFKPGDFRGIDDSLSRPLRTRYSPTLIDDLYRLFIPLQSPGLGPTDTSAHQGVQALVHGTCCILASIDGHRPKAH